MKNLLLALPFFLAVSLPAVESCSVKFSLYRNEILDHTETKTVNYFNWFSFTDLLNGASPYRLEIKEGKAAGFLKTRALFVGLDEYEDFDWLDTCVNDALVMREILSSNSFTTSQILTNKFATKAAIRNAIKQAAIDTQNNENFIYFHSSHGDEDPYCLCTFDNTYTVSELAEDLSGFKEYANIILIFDACFAGGMYPKNFAAELVEKMAVLKSKKRGLSLSSARADVKANLFFIASSQPDEFSWVTDTYSLFTSCFVEYGCAPTADVTKDGVLSFGEIFNAARQATLDFYPNTQEPYILMPESASYHLTAYSRGGQIGTLMADSTFEGPNPLFYFDVRVAKDLDISLYLSSEKKTENKTATFNYNVSLKFGETGDLPEKLTWKFSLPADDLEISPDMPAFVTSQVGGASFPLSATLFKGNSKGTSYTYVLTNERYVQCGAMKLKINYKKNLVTCQIKLNEDGWFHLQFPKSNDLVFLNTTCRVGSFVSTGNFPVNVKYKPGKKLTSKLAKLKH